MKTLKYILCTASIAILLASCSKDYFDTTITSYLDSETAAKLAAEDPSALDSYLLSAFSFMSSWNVSGNSAHDDFSHMSVMHSMDMMGQDICMAASHWFNYDYQHDNHEFNYRRTKVDWLTYYTIISKANEILGFFPEVPATAESKGVMAHGYALRAFSYYYLIQLYQHPVTSTGAVNWDAPGVPLMYNANDGKTTEEIEAAKGRNTVKDVYALIESDLTKAVELFEAGYTRPSKIYIDQYVANGLLARYYLLSQQWEKAAAAAKKAQAGGQLVANQTPDFMDITDSEWLWGYDHNTESQTTYASFFSHVSDRTPGYAGLNYAARLIDKKLYESIPDTDIRKAWFNGPSGNSSQTQPGAKLPYANLKFGNISDWTMDYMYMRVPEMYLIEAEAYAHQNNLTAAAQAIAPLMAVREPGWNQSEITLDEIILQRRIELWGEGFNSFDLKRLNLGIDRNYSGSNHLTGYKLQVPALDKTWIYQIPKQEMDENKLIDESEQND